MLVQQQQQRQRHVACHSRKLLLLGCFVALCLSATWMTQCSGEYFSSIDSIQLLSMAEKDMVAWFQEYLKGQSDDFAFIRKYIAQVKVLHAEALEDVEGYLGNPINAFTLIKRTVADWERLREDVKQNPRRAALNTKLQELQSDVSAPEGSELRGAAKGLGRLQTMYNLTAVHLADGIINGVEYDTELSLRDSFEIAANLFESKEYALSIQWFEVVLLILDFQAKEELAKAKQEVSAQTKPPLNSDQSNDSDDSNNSEQEADEDGKVETLNETNESLSSKVLKNAQTAKSKTIEDGNVEIVDEPSEPVKEDTAHETFEFEDYVEDPSQAFEIEEVTDDDPTQSVEIVEIGDEDGDDDSKSKDIKGEPIDTEKDEKLMGGVASEAEYDDSSEEQGADSSKASTDNDADETEEAETNEAKDVDTEDDNGTDADANAESEDYYDDEDSEGSEIEIALDDTIRLHNATYKMLVDTIEYLALAHYELNQVEAAAEYIRDLLDLEPSHTFADVQTYMNIMEAKKIPVMDTLSQLNKHSWFANYTRLCQGSQVPDETIKGLTCELDTKKHPIFILAPLKKEQLHRNPEVYTYYDLLTDGHIWNIVEATEMDMHRSQVGNSSLSAVRDVRVSQQTWLPYDTPTTRYIYNIVSAISGFDLENAENMQVANYGVGGQYDPHFDYFGSGYDDETSQWTGDRLATHLFYLSDVEQGGYTVFPKLNLYSRPVKGSMLMWHNLHKSVDPDPRTLHAGCPVIKGTKRISNVWVHAGYQEFRRPCELVRDTFKSAGVSSTED